MWLYYVDEIMNENIFLHISILYYNKILKNNIGWEAIGRIMWNEFI